MLAGMVFIFFAYGMLSRKTIESDGRFALNNRFKPAHQSLFDGPVNGVKLVASFTGSDSKESKNVEKQISVLIRHGVTQQALGLLNQLAANSERTKWSSGRVCWYISLCHRMESNEAEALRWGLQASKNGIPELSSDHSSFWSQYFKWTPRSEYSFCLANRPSMEGVVSPAAVPPGKDPVVETAKQLFSEIQKCQDELRDATDDGNKILAEIRLATWELLLGEYAAFHESLSIPTSSIDSFARGKMRLNEIEAKIKLKPELEDEISMHPELAIRLDSARVRLVSLENKEASARSQEVARLRQLRVIAREYRSLCSAMLDWQIQQTLHDPETAMASAAETLDSMKKIFDEISSRRDYHLFDDEPAIDGDSEVEILQIAPVPFSTSSLSMVKALQGYQYLKASENDSSNVNEHLESAETWAKASLGQDDNVDGVPQGSDPDNLVAKLVLGQAELNQGLSLALGDDAGERDISQAHFKNARDTLTSLVTIVDAGDYTGTRKLPDAARTYLLELQTSDYSKSRASSLLAAGEPQSARDSLQRAIKIHRDKSCALQSLEIGLRAGLDPERLKEEWSRFISHGIFSKDDPVADLSLAKIVNTEAGYFLANGIHGNSGSLIDELNEVATRLARWLDSIETENDTSFLTKANYALAITYKLLLSGASPSAKDLAEIESAYRHARDSEYFLTAKLKEIEGGAQKMEVDALRESLIACRLASGHLAAMHLEQWRDDSQILFTAAAAEAARLDNSSPFLALAGEPLLKQFFKNSDTGALQLANEERTRRQMVTRCIEAMFSTLFGEKVAGADLMNHAVEIGLKSADNLGDLSITELSAAVDGFDAKVSLPDTIRSFGVLSDIESKQFEKALLKAISLASRGVLSLQKCENFTQLHADQFLNRIESPLVAFTFAKSLESYIASLPIAQEIGRREWLASTALTAYQKASSLLRAERLAARYPHLLAMIDQSTARLTDSVFFMQEAEGLLAERRYSEAASILVDGISKHPRNSDLWGVYFRCQLAMVAFSGDNDELNFRLLIEQIEGTRKQGLLDAFSAASMTAKIYEAIADYKEALKHYRIAEDRSSSADQRISSVSNAERLRVVLLQLAAGS